MLKLDNISFSYDGKKNILKDISLELKKGEIVAILGQSGSGKSSLLKIIVGLLNQKSGSIFLGNKDISKLECNHRDIGLVFQDYALFPHMNVEKNISFPLTKNKKETVDKLLELIRMKDLRYSFPHQLSGGEKQRVAIARSLAANPKVLLLDEPFSNLDEELKDKLRMELKDLLQKSEVTTIIVTHDKNDAITLSDRIVYLKDGLIDKIEINNFNSF